jgi:hypothetical protein
VTLCDSSSSWFSLHRFWLFGFSPFILRTIGLSAIPDNGLLLNKLDFGIGKAFEHDAHRKTGNLSILILGLKGASIFWQHSGDIFFSSMRSR